MAADYGSIAVKKYSADETIQYNGKWFMYRLNDFPDSPKKDCVVSEYKILTKDDHTVVDIGKDKISKKTSTFESSIYFSKKGLGLYSYNKATVDDVEEDVQIIETDYKTYSIEWTCNGHPAKGKSESYLYLFTREPTPTEATKNRFNNFMKKHNFDIKKTREVIQSKKECARKKESLKTIKSLIEI